LEFAVEGNIQRFAELGRLLEVADSNASDADAAQALVTEVTRFCKALEIPTLTELGVDKDAFMANLDKMADDALESGSPQNTMRIPTKEQIIEIYKKLF
jgi:1,3-propanediol dehydrogenase